MSSFWRGDSRWAAMAKGVLVLLSTPAFAHPGEHSAHTAAQWLAAAAHTVTETDHLLVLMVLTLLMLALSPVVAAAVWRRHASLRSSRELSSKAAARAPQR